MSKIVKTYDGIAKDVETIIRLKPWIIDEISDELRGEGLEASEFKFEWAYLPETETFEYQIHAIS